MIYYLLVVSLSAFFMMISSLSLSSGGRHTFASFLGFILSVSVVAVFSCIRDPAVGTDTLNYITYFSDLKDEWFLSDVLDEVGDPLFFYVVHYIRSLSDDYFYYLFFVAVVTTWLYLAAILKLDIKKVSSFFVFVFLGYCFFHFNGARQALALAVSFYSLTFLFSGSKLKFFICIGIASLLHKSALVCLPFSFVFGIRLSWKIMLGYLVMFSVGLMVFSRLPSILEGMGGRYSTYADTKDGGTALLTTLFYLAILIWLIASKWLYSIKDKVFEFSVILYGCGVMIALLSTLFSLSGTGIYRFSHYFLQVGIIAIPYTISTRKGMGVWLFSSVAIYGALLFYFCYSLYSFSDFTPYLMDCSGR